VKVGLGILVAILSTCGGLSVAATQGNLLESVVALLSRQQPGFRLANPNDFLPKLDGERRGVVFAHADLNADGQIDSAVLVVNEELKEYRVYLVLGGRENLQLLFSRKWTPLSGAHPIRTPMFLKPAGEARGRSYSPLTSRETAVYTVVPPLKCGLASSTTSETRSWMNWAIARRFGTTIRVSAGTSKYVIDFRLQHHARG
jgi:hypothetical protein